VASHGKFGEAPVTERNPDRYEKEEKRRHAHAIRRKRETERVKGLATGKTKEGRAANRTWKK